MATHSAIADAGETIVELLKAEMGRPEGIIEEDEIGLASPEFGGASGGRGSNLRLTLYLYRVEENANLKNERRREVEPDRATDPPLALDLSYLLTAHPAKGRNGSKTARSKDQHRVLGRAVQVLRDHSVLRGSALKGSLAGDAELRISMNSRSAESTDEIATIWNSFSEKSFEPSVSYSVTPVEIESEQESAVRRVVEKTEKYYVQSGGEDE